MKSKYQIIILLTFMFLTTIRFGFAQEEECGAVPPKNYKSFMLKRLNSITQKKALAAPISVAIQHHVSRTSSGGSPALSSAQIQNVMDELNATYAPMNISFHEYGPTKYVDNSSWNSSFDKGNDSQLVQYEVADAINIFYFSKVNSTSGSSICGFGKFPGSGNRVILKVSCSQNGSTASHELGHYFSILHTHSTSDGKELVQRTNCSSTGDFFCDTPADPRLSSSLVSSSCNYTGSATDSNGDQYQPDTHNVMSYTRKSCRTGGFSSQQQDAIVTSLESDRTNLSIISVTPDNEAPTAPSGLTASNIGATVADLSWTASTDNVGVTQYEIFQNGNSIGTATTTTYQVTGLTAETAYSFTVKAKDRSDNVSANSNVTNITTTISLAQVGVTSIGVSSSKHTERRAMPYTMSENGILQSITIHTSGGTSDMQLGVYDDNNGAPGNRLGSTSVTATRSNLGWQTVALQSPIAVNNGDTIWLAWIFSNNPGVSYGDGTPGRYQADGSSWSTGGDNIPSNFGSGVQTNYKYSVYANYHLSIDTEAPTTPSELTASNIQAATVDLSWTASTDNIGVTQYEIFQDGNSIGIATTTTYQVTGLTAETAYSFTVKAKDATGNVSGDSNIVNVTTLSISDTQAPTVPSGLSSANSTQTTVDLSWTASTDNVGVTQYEIFQNGNSIGTTTTTTSFNVTGLTAETSYSFTVKAKDAAGNVSADSTVANVTTLPIPDTQDPTVPSGLTTSNIQATTVALSWTASTDNVGVTEYEIFQDGNSIGTATTTTYQVTGLTAETAYSFTVKAKDATGNVSGDSNIANATTLPIPDTQAPTAPSGLSSANSTQTTVDLSWTASTDNIGVTEYEVFQDGNSIGTTTTTTYNVTGLTAETAYSFTVNAKDVAGNVSVDSNIVNATTLPIPDTQAPTVPSNLTTSNIGTTTVNLSWTASTDNVGVTEYEVFQDGNSIGTATTTTYQVTELTAETAYSFIVKAKDATGNVSGDSNIVNVTTAAVPACTGINSFPYRKSFEPDFGSWTQETNDDIDWSLDSNSTPSSSTGPSAPTHGSNYIFTEASGSGDGFPNKTALLTSPCIDLSNQPSSELSFDYHMYGSNMGTLEIRVSTDSGTTWTTIWSLNGNQGNSWSSQVIDLSTYGGSVIKLQLKGTTGSGYKSDMAIDNINIISTTPDTQSPTVPNNLTASNIGTTTVDLSWTASTDNVGVTEYEIFQNGTSVGTSATTSYSITGLTAETAYSFTVNAKDEAGNVSGGSNVANVTTTAVPACTGINSFPYRKSFEPDFGSWTQETNDDIDWSLDSNSTPSSSTGPSAPTHGSNYIFTEASGSGDGYPNKTALLTSPCIDLSNQPSSELSFDYHMYGSNMGTLEIRVSTDDGTTWTTIWSLNGNQGNSWNSQVIDLSTYGGNVIKLQLKGTTGSSYRSDMAIDNINITSDSADSHKISDIDTTNQKVSIYPNPITSGSLSIHHSGFSKSKGAITITITNFLGQTIDSFDSNSEITSYDVNSLNSGVYFIIIRNNQEQVTKKFIKR